MCKFSSMQRSFNADVRRSILELDMTRCSLSQSMCLTPNQNTFSSLNFAANCSYLHFKKARKYQIALRSGTVSHLCPIPFLCEDFQDPFHILSPTTNEDRPESNSTELDREHQRDAEPIHTNNIVVKNSVFLYIFLS